MENKTNWHRHLGIYGVCIRNGKLLVIHKNGGPYTNRFDLPGGSIEPKESILETVIREFIEETGVKVQIKQNIGVKDFIVPWKRAKFEHTHCHHIAIFYEVIYISGDVKDSLNIDDSMGAEWMDVEQINTNNSSPLVMAAIEWMKMGKLSLNTSIYKEWVVKE
mgnify:CR=1 FL=1